MRPCSQRQSLLVSAAGTCLSHTVLTQAEEQHPILPTLPPTGRRNVELLAAWLEEQQAAIDEHMRNEDASRASRSNTATNNNNNNNAPNATAVGASGRQALASLQVKQPRSPVRFIARLQVALDVARAAEAVAERDSDDDTPPYEDAAASEAAAAALMQAEDEVRLHGLSSTQLLDYIKRGQHLYSVAFHELTRQVASNCADRGHLMAK